MTKRFLLLAAAACVATCALGNRVVNNVAAGGGVPTLTVVDSYSGTASTTTVDLDATGIAEGTLMLAFVVHGSTADISAVPSGWTLVAAQDDGNSSDAPDSNVYSKIAGASEGSYNWTLASLNRASAVLVSVANESGVSDSAVSSTATLGVVTVPTSGLAVAFVGLAHASDTVAGTPPGTYTERFDNGATGRRIACFVADYATAGDTNGTDAYAFSQGNPNSIHVAIAP